MIQHDCYVTDLVSQFIIDTHYVLKPIKKEVEVGDMIIYDNEKHKIINYGTINDVIKTKKFQKWVKRKEREDE